MPLNWRYMFHGYLVEPCSSSRSEVCPFSIVTCSLLSKYMDSLQLQKARRQNPHIFMESPLVHGTAYMVLSFIVIVLFALVHARLTKLGRIFCTEKVWAVAPARESRSHTKAVGPKKPIWRRTVANTDADTDQAEQDPNPHWIRTDLCGASPFTYMMHPSAHSQNSQHWSLHILGMPSLKPKEQGIIS